MTPHPQKSWKTLGLNFLLLSMLLGTIPGVILGPPEYRQVNLAVFRGSQKDPWNTAKYPRNTAKYPWNTARSNWRYFGGHFGTP